MEFVVRGFFFGYSDFLPFFISLRFNQENEAEINVI